MLDPAAPDGEDRRPMVFSEQDRAVLDFERAWWTRRRPKEAAIREHLAMSSTSYYDRLRRIVDCPAAYDYDPLTVRRVRRRVEQRRRLRVVGRPARPGSR